MKKLLFTPIILIVLLLPICLINYTWQTSFTKETVNLKPSKRVYIFGDSHGACSFTPKHIDQTTNYSNWGESVVFSYYKLKYLLESSQVDSQSVVALVFSYHTLYPCRENYLLPEQRNEILLNYYPFLDNSGKDLVGRTGVEFFLTQLKYDFGFPLMLKKHLLAVKQNRNDAIAGFSTSEKTQNVSREHAQHKINIHFNNNQDSTSQTLEDYLGLMAELTGRYNLQLVLVNTPKHPFYNDLLPERVLTAHNRVVKDVTVKYNHVKYLDYSKQFSDSTYFRDTDHLNMLGAKEFSIMFDQAIHSD